MVYFSDLRAKIEGFNNLGRGWDSYGGVPPSPSLVARALSILDACHQVNLQPTGVCPGPSGDIAFYFQARGCDVELSVKEDTLEVFVATEPLRMEDSQEWAFPDTPENRVVALKLVMESLATGRPSTWTSPSA